MASKNAKAQAKTDWFVNDRFGMFIHWGLYSMAARHEWVKNREKISTAGYQKYFDHFNPDLYDPKAWARSARLAGMKYFVITTRHHEGFCLWDSKHTDYKATLTPCGKDLLTPMVEAFRNEGLKVGFYYSLLDWHHPEFPVDKLHPMRENQEERTRNSKRDVRKYAKYMRDQVKELLTQFGKIDILWFDFSYPGEDGKGHQDWESEEMVKLIRKLQPEIMLDNRLDLPDVGDFITPEQFQPVSGICDKNGKPAVWEACQTFSGSWGYHRDELTWREPSELVATLIDSVSKNGNLLMNVGPTARGEFDSRAQSRLDAYAKWMHFNSRSIYGCGAAPAEFKCPEGCKLTWNEKESRLYIHILSWPYKHIPLYGKAYKERIEYGQFLHDASELSFKGLEDWQRHFSGVQDESDITFLDIPQTKPEIEIPVVELFVKK